jgi:hypothetical protein
MRICRWPDRHQAPFYLVIEPSNHGWKGWEKNEGDKVWQNSVRSAKGRYRKPDSV